MAIRESILLRGLIFETDETMRRRPRRHAADSSIRGVTPSGDAAETFAIANGKASWTSPVDKGGAPYSARRFLSAAGRPVPRQCAGRSIGCSPPVARAGAAPVRQCEFRQGHVARRSMDRKARSMSTSIFVRGPARLRSPSGSRTASSSAFCRARACFRRATKANLDKMQAAQDAAIAAIAPATAKKFLTADARRPVLFSNVKMYDADRRALPRSPLRADERRQDRLRGHRAPAKLPAGTRDHRRRRQDARPGAVGQPHARRRRLQTSASSRLA